MQIIIAGCGETGSLAANTLSKEGHDIIVIDKDKLAFRRLDDAFEGVTVEGLAIDKDILIESGIETCDALIALTSNDNINLMTCEIAKKLFNVEKAVALVSSRGAEKVFNDLGIDLVCHTELTFDMIRSCLGNKEHVALSTIIDGYEFDFYNIKVDDEDAGKLIKDINVKRNIHIFGIIRNCKFMYASPSVTILEGDVLIVSECLNMK